MKLKNTWHETIQTNKYINNECASCECEVNTRPHWICTKCNCMCARLLSEQYALCLPLLLLLRLRLHNIVYITTFDDFVLKTPQKKKIYRINRPTAIIAALSIRLHFCPVCVVRFKCQETIKYNEKMQRNSNTSKKKKCLIFIIRMHVCTYVQCSC